MASAVQVADADGLGALTMRRLGSELGVEAMSLYKHVANKDEILDGIVEVVMGEIELPGDTDWKTAMRKRAVSAREVLNQHSWAIGLLESRASSTGTVLRYLDAILGSLLSAGFSVGDAGYVFTLLDAYVYGHVIQESGLGTSGASLDPNAVADTYPNLAEAMAHAARADLSMAESFEFGLELILDALEHRAGG